MSLRFVLLIIGVLLVVGVYLWSASRRERGSRLTYDPHFTRIEPARRPGPSARLADVEDPAAADAMPDLAQLPPHQDDELVDLPRITLDRRADRPVPARDAQLEMHFDAPPEDAAHAPGAADAAARRGASPEPDLLVIYIRAPGDGAFAGTEVRKALNRVGMRFGDLGIFHHFGAGELRSERPVFSVANMLEPGHFDLDRIDSLKIKGLAMFLQLPAPLDGAVAFELFLNTAQRTAEALSGELYGDPRTRLTNLSIDRMRRTATRHRDDGL